MELVYTRDLKSLASAYGFESRPDYHIMKKLLLALLLAPSIASAQVAAVVAIRGDVEVNGAKVEQGALVDNGDTIEAADRSFAVLRFTDGSKVTIRPSSVFTIDNFSYMEGKDEARFALATGGLRIVTGAIAKSNPENYTLNTPVALMGVRGTEFAIYLEGK